MKQPELSPYMMARKPSGIRLGQIKFLERKNPPIYANKYALDKTVQDWMRDVNPWALQRIAEILLEAAQRGYWDADPETLQDLQSLYLSIEGVIEGR